MFRKLKSMAQKFFCGKKINETLTCTEDGAQCNECRAKAIAAAPPEMVETMVVQVR